MRILIAEDDERLAQSIKIHLETKGHEVHWATGGKSAFTMLRQSVYGGVISDIQMPDGNGIALLQESWLTLSSPPPFYVHSSENIFYWADRQWDLPEVISGSFKDFAIFRNKKIPDMLQEIERWIDSIEKK